MNKAPLWHQSQRQENAMQTHGGQQQNNQNSNALLSVVAKRSKAKKGGKTMKAPHHALFPSKLYRILSGGDGGGSGGDDDIHRRSSFDDIISWLPDGKSFRIYDCDRFSAEVMPIYFGTSNLRSFQRNLNLWGFKKSTGIGEWSHPLFRQDMPNLYQEMKRVGTKAATAGTTPTGSSKKKKNNNKNDHAALSAESEDDDDDVSTEERAVEKQNISSNNVKNAYINSAGGVPGQQSDDLQKLVLALMQRQQMPALSEGIIKSLFNERNILNGSSDRPSSPYSSSVPGEGNFASAAPFGNNNNANNTNGHPPPSNLPNFDISTMISRSLGIPSYLLDQQQQLRYAEEQQKRSQDDTARTDEAFLRALLSSLLSPERAIPTAEEDRKRNNLNLLLSLLSSSSSNREASLRGSSDFLSSFLPQNSHGMNFQPSEGSLLHSQQGEDKSLGGLLLSLLSSKNETGSNAPKFASPHPAPLAPSTQQSTLSTLASLLATTRNHQLVARGEEQQQNRGHTMVPPPPTQGLSSNVSRPPTSAFAMNNHDTTTTTTNKIGTFLDTNTLMRMKLAKEVLEL